MDLTTFEPFQASVWGAVSDWAMVIVAGVTGLLIWLTFKSQLKIIKIEEYRHRLQMMPILEVALNQTSSIILADEILEMYVVVDIKLQNINNARNLQINMPKNGYWTYITQANFRVNIVSPKDLIQVIFMTKKRFTIVNGEDYTQAYISFELHFTDEISNNYSQSVNYLYTSGSQKLNITSPSYVET